MQGRQKHGRLHFWAVAGNGKKCVRMFCRLFSDSLSPTGTNPSELFNDHRSSSTVVVAPLEQLLST